MRSVLPLTRERQHRTEFHLNFIAAYITYHRTARKFKKGGIRKVISAPLERREPRRYGIEDGERAIFSCKSIAYKLHGLGTTFLGEGACLRESLSLWRALRTLGYEAEIVIAHPLVASFENPDLLHAWVELDNVPIDSRTDLTTPPSTYIELLRLREESDWRG
ncbi:hypothetical protein GS584_14860 [Rhodococcus hoagii]|nr:hypothetical protein [Prescottella equi]